MTRCSCAELTTLLAKKITPTAGARPAAACSGPARAVRASAVDRVRAPPFSTQVRVQRAEPRRSSVRRHPGEGGPLRTPASGDYAGFLSGQRSNRGRVGSRVQVHTCRRLGDRRGAKGPPGSPGTHTERLPAVACPSPSATSRRPCSITSRRCQAGVGHESLRPAGHAGRGYPRGADRGNGAWTRMVTRVGRVGGCSERKSRTGPA